MFPNQQSFDAAEFDSGVQNISKGWQESLHPRDGGKFAAKQGGVSAAGSLAGYGGYMAAGHGITRYNKKQQATWTKPQENKFKEYRKASGMPYDSKEFMAQPRHKKDAFFRNFPEELPGGKTRRLLSHTHGAYSGGRARVVAPVMAVSAAAAMGGSAFHRALERKSLKDRVETALPSKKHAKQAAFAVAGTAGAAYAAKTGTGALALRAATKNPGKITKLAEEMNAGHHPKSGGLGFSGARQARMNPLKSPTKRKLHTGINNWEDRNGIRRQLSFGPGSNKLKDRLSPKYADHRLFNMTVQSAPATKTPLHRGILMDPKDLNDLQKGKVWNRGMESWSDNEVKAGKFADDLLKKKAHAGKQKVVLHTKGDFKALNIQGQAKYRMNEWVGDKPYRIKSVSTDKDGTKHVRVTQAEEESKYRSYGKNAVQDAPWSVGAGTAAVSGSGFAYQSLK